MLARTALQRLERAQQQVRRAAPGGSDLALREALRLCNRRARRLPDFQSRRPILGALAFQGSPWTDPALRLKEARARTRGYIPYLALLRERQPLETEAALRGLQAGSERWQEGVFSLVSSHLFPLNEWAYEDLLETEMVYLAPPNERESADSLYETLCDPTCLDPAAWFYWFLLYCDVQVDREQWELAEGHFGWGVPAEDMPQARGLRWDLFEQIANPGMLAAYLFAAQATGNLVLDYSYEDAVQDTRYLASSENLRRLADDWRAGQAWLRQFQQAERRAAQDRSALRQFARAMTACSFH